MVDYWLSNIIKYLSLIIGINKTLVIDKSLKYDSKSEVNSFETGVVL
jgi:hypothetical protein